MIEFIYCNEVRLSEDLAFDLLDLSDKYAFSDLRKGCEWFLKERIRVDNCVELAKIADLLQLEGLEKAVMEFISSHWEAVSKRNEVTELPSKPFYQKLSHK